jgi:hypothetical protein
MDRNAFYRENMVSIEPKNLDIPFNLVNSEDTNSKVVVTRYIKVRNTGLSVTRFGFRVLQHMPEFQIRQSMRGKLFPGEYEEIRVDFTPFDWTPKSMTIYIREGTETELIPVSVMGIL